MYPSLEQIDRLIDALPKPTSEGELVPVHIQKRVLTRPDAFESSFVQPQKAQEQLELFLTKARELVKLDDIQCATWPPLLVRYKGQHDVTVPVAILDNGELQQDKRHAPDMILGFSARFGSILVTVCNVTKQKEPLYKFVQDILFAMESKEPLDLAQFQRLYDTIRYEQLQKRRVK